MGRSLRELRAHPEFGLYEAWSKDLEGRVGPRTADQYRSDVARFLWENPTIRATRVGEDFLVDYWKRLKPGSRRRMMTALGRFFHYALERRMIPHDPVYGTKYRRGEASAQQLTVFSYLKEDGVPERQIRALLWSDVVVAFMEKPYRRRLRVQGKGRRLRPRTWRGLKLLFLRHAIPGHDPIILLRSRVAS
jgi:hypothetical protein